jgi:ParB family chromosome partitioning protein
MAPPRGPVMARRAAGRALEERLSRSFGRIPAEDIPRVFRLRLDEILPNPDQPRRRVDPEALKELAASIERHGLIQPITVQRRGEGGGYLLVAGERRYRAHALLGQEEILAIVTSGAADEIALIENIQREGLHPLEEAAAFARLMAAHGWTQEQLAETVGKARPTVTNTLKLNGLAPSIQAACRDRGDVSKSLLFEIARHDDHQDQERLWARLKGGGTVRAARAQRPGFGAGWSGGAGEADRDPVSAVVATGRRLQRQVAALEAGAGGLEAELAALGRALDRLLARLAPPVGAGRGGTPSRARGAP